MHRRILSIAALAVLAAACHRQTVTATPAPASPNTSVNAGGPGGPDGPGRGGPGRGDQMVFRGITLTSDQQQRVDSIRNAYRTQMEQMRQNAGGDREAMRAQMRPMMEKQQADLRAVLTSEQQVQFDQNVSEMRSRMGQGRPGGGSPPR